MKEILFRGKRKDIGEWVEGDFVHPCNIVFEKIGYDEVLKQNNVNICHDYAVIPETVGQFTGLTDKDGKKIFEGDIVRTLLFHSAEAQAALWDGIVVYDNEQCCYVIEIQPLCMTLLFRNCEVEVVGNIHDDV